MTMIAASGGALFVLASLIVGGRLLLLSRVTRGLPEFLLGLGLFCMGGVGYPLMMLITRLDGISDTTRSLMLVAHMCTSVLGMGGIAWFTRRVFRPTERWAGLLLAAVVGGFVLLALVQIIGPGMAAFIENPKSGPWSMKVYLSFVPMTWAGVESIRYFGLLRRRLALGLADPVVTDRFRLWGIAILSADAITVFGIAFNMTGQTITSSPIGALLVGGFGLTTAACLWLAFIPPQAYVARIARLGVQSPGTSASPTENP